MADQNAKRAEEDAKKAEATAAAKRQDAQAERREANKDEKAAKLTLNEEPDEKDEPEYPASESRVGHAIELGNEEIAERDMENAKEGARRKAGDPLGLQKAAEDVDEEEVKLNEATKRSKADLKRSNGMDFCKVTMVKTTVAPTVGAFDVAKELGLQGLQEGKTYEVPISVAAVLVDSKNAILNR